MSVLRRRWAIALIALVTTVLLPVGGVVFAEDPPVPPPDQGDIGFNMQLWPDPPCYLCDETQP